MSWPVNRRTITIRDVAERAGVSESTVSRVLTGAGTQIPISEDTRGRVQQAASDLCYRPHPGARSLGGKRTHLIGLIVREISDPWFAQIIEAISRVACERGYDLVLGNAAREPQEALALRQMMLDLRYCDGLILCGDLRESAEDRTFLNQMRQDHNLISVSRGSRDLVLDTPCVGVDNRSGTFLALEYLTTLGHRRIGCIRAARSGDLGERVDAYGEFMQTRFGAINPAYIAVAANSFEDGYQAARQLLSLPVPPTAIFAADDRLAIGAMAYALDAGLKVPGDVSVIGFDDMDFGTYVRPALTTVRQPLASIAEQAVEMLLTMIQGEANSDVMPQLFLEPVLMRRASCGAPSAA
jgi:DNA-binding LacI/PurR family transcriptional regulator